MNLNALLKNVALRYGDKPAIIDGTRRLSYANLEEQSNRFANALSGLGVRRGDRVAMLLGNSPEFIVAFFGTVKIGAIAVPMDSKYKLAEVKALFADCRPRVLLTESPAVEPLVAAMPGFDHLEKVIDLSPRPSGQFLSFSQLLSDSTAIPVRHAPSEDDTAVIAYTSGATFEPRGIMLTHGSMAFEAEISGEGFAQTDRDIVPVFALPLHHAAGLTIVGLTSIYRGSSLVMLGGLSMAGILELIEKERVTMLIGVPFVFSLLATHAESEGIKNDISSLRLCASGGSPLPVEVSRRFKELYGHHIAQFWGLTEISAHITVQAVDGSGIPGSIGKPLRGCEVKVVDDRDAILPADKTGELICRGPLMQGYYNKPDATAEVLKNGWLYTGDIGHIDAEGNIFITGRKKDMIIPKGQNIVPDDIELVLSWHPKVAESAVMGIPDDPRGEVIVAVIRLKEGENATESEMRRICLDNLANFKVPKEYLFIDFQLPRVEGRVDKQALRKKLGLAPVFPAHTPR